MTVDASPFLPLRPVSPDEDRYAVLYGIDWETYERLRDRLGNGLRLTYLRGTLEIMSPSYRHEDIKTLIARLIEVWAIERNVDLNGYGNVTLKLTGERALEPDECYAIGRVEETPDFAIEVVLSAGDLDKLEAYKKLGVREVWGYKAGAFSVLALVGEDYEPRAKSAVLPELDLNELGGFVKPGQSQTSLVRAYQALLQSKAPRPA